MSGNEISLRSRIAQGIARDVDPAVRAFAQRLAHDAGAHAALFYGSNLRTGELEGVLDYYLLLPGPPERGLWPRVSYHEWTFEGTDLRAKVATMTLARFAEAAGGTMLDATIWARFVQPSALVWCKDEAVRAQVIDALGNAAKVAARLAVAGFRHLTRHLGDLATLAVERRGQRHDFRGEVVEAFAQQGVLALLGFPVRVDVRRHAGAGGNGARP